MTLQDKPTGTAVPTLEDVAATAGVSTATVSRCLNAPDRVSEKTRDKVLRTVRELGYAPNFGARALAAKRTNTFGAIIPTMENAIFARGLQAFQEELGKAGVTLLVTSSSYDPAREENQIAALLNRGADALLLIGHDRTPAAREMLARREVPHVVAWAFDPAAASLSIGFDNTLAMQALAAEVIAQGHRRLAVITAELAGNDRVRARLDGVRAAMTHAGLNTAALAVEETPYGIDTGAEAFARLMRLRPRPTAVLCANDVLAAGALMKARQVGLQVPGDISITGFDDIELAAIVTPGLTTVHVPHREMGRRAARALLAMDRGEEPGGSVDLPTTLTWRGSLGPAPGA